MLAFNRPIKGPWPWAHGPWAHGPWALGPRSMGPWALRPKVKRENAKSKIQLHPGTKIHGASSMRGSIRLGEALWQKRCPSYPKLHGTKHDEEMRTTSQIRKNYDVISLWPYSPFIKRTQRRQTFLYNTLRSDARKCQVTPVPMARHGAPW